MNQSARRTGRTTRMVEAVCAHICEGNNSPMIVIAHSREKHNILRMIQERIPLQREFDLSGVRFKVVNDPDVSLHGNGIPACMVRGINHEDIFVDHHALEILDPYYKEGFNPDDIYDTIEEPSPRNRFNNLL